MVFVLGTALLVLALASPTLAFVPIGGGSATHVSITGDALLQKVTEVCKAVAKAEGHEFEPTVGWAATTSTHQVLWPTNMINFLNSSNKTFMALI